MRALVIVIILVVAVAAGGGAVSSLQYAHDRDMRRAFEAGAYYGAEYVWDNQCDHLPSMTAREEACDKYMARQ